MAGKRCSATRTGSILALAALCLLLPLSSALAREARWSGLADPVFSSLGAGQIATAIAQDGDGFLWIGTQSGLARWDGYRFKFYKPDADGSGGLPDVNITCLHVARDGRLWIGTGAGGLARHDPATGGFTIFAAGPDGLSHPHVRTIAEDESGDLWIATDGGLDHLDTKTGVSTHFKHDPADGASLPDDRITALLTGHAGELWVGTRQGLVRRGSGMAGFMPVPLPGVAGQEIKSLFEDGAGRVWIGTLSRGAFVAEPGGAPRPVQETVDTGLASQNVRAIAEAAPGEVWLGTYGQGIVVVDTRSWRTRRIRHEATRPTSLAHDAIWALYRDRARSLWIGTASGLSRFDPGSMAIATLFGDTGRGDGLAGDDVYSVFSAADGRIWAGTNKGVSILDPDGARIVTPRPDPAHPDSSLPEEGINGLVQGPSGDIFIGTRRGLYRADADGRHVARIVLSRPHPDMGITYLLLAKGDLWIGTRNEGFWRYDPAHGAVLGHWGEELDNQMVETVTPADAGRLWVGTQNGLYRLTIASGAAESFRADAKDPEALPASYVSSLLTDRGGRVWVATQGGGIALIKGYDEAGRPRFRRLGVTQGLPNDAVDMLVEGTDGRVWASTDDGLAAIDPETLTITVLRRAEGVSIPVYWVNSGAATPQGEILFGGKGGLTVVRPDLLQPWGYHPPVMVTDVQVGGKRVGAASGPLTVTPEANSLSVEFSAPDFTAPERNRYAYKLEGFDRDWVETDWTKRLASYTNLPPGDYTLRLKGSNRDGAWSEKTPPLSIHVVPAWDQTWWFRGALGLAALLAVALLVRARTAYLTVQREALERQVTDRTRELSESLAALTEAQESLVRSEKLASLGQLVAGIAHEINTPVGNALVAATQTAEETARIEELAGAGSLRRQDLALHFETVRELTAILVRNCQRAAGLIGDFKQVAVDRTSGERRRFDLGRHLRETLHTLDHRFRRMGVALVLDVPEDIEMDSFPGFLSQAVINLAENALSHAFAEPGRTDYELRVAVRASAPDRAEIAVSDNGKGIAPEAMPKIFDPFFTTNRGAGNTGLGLHIVHNLATGPLGGDIRVESVPGRGTLFVLTLPKDSSP